MEFIEEHHNVESFNRKSYITYEAKKYFKIMTKGA